MSEEEETKYWLDLGFIVFLIGNAISTVFLLRILSRDFNQNSFIAPRSAFQLKILKNEIHP